MAVAVAVAVNGVWHGVAMPVAVLVAVPVAGLKKNFNHIQKDFLINDWGYLRFFLLFLIYPSLIHKKLICVYQTMGDHINKESLSTFLRRPPSWKALPQH